MDNNWPKINAYSKAEKFVSNTYKKPEKWSNPKNKLFKYQAAFTCPPQDYCGAPSDFLRMAPETVGVHGRMLHVPDYQHELTQRNQNFH